MRSLDLDLPRQQPAKRPAQERRRDFAEIDRGFTTRQAMLEARRCVQCSNPPCALFGCPVSHRIPEWIDHIVEGRFREAWRVISQRNNLAEACGKLCPQEVLCESRCVVRHVGPPVAIGKLEAFIAQMARQQGWYDGRAAAAPTGKRVAIVGSGPAGLSAAEELLLRGHSVVVYERQKNPGGLLVYGIPNFKFAKERIEELIERIKNRGGEFRCGVEVDRDLTADELLNDGQEKCDAVLLAVGAEVGRMLSIPGAELGNVHRASDFLIAGNLGRTFIEQPPIAIEVGRTCAVFGGGDTAMDCVRTALRLGFEKVLCLYRRSEKEMPGREEDRHNAIQEGVEFCFLAGPVRFLGRDRVEQVECVKMRLGPPDESGRAWPEPIPGSEFTIEAATVVLALGYTVDPALAAAFGLDLERGVVKVSADLSTSRAGVFAAGDAVNGADLVVTAVRDGRAAARGIHRYLTSTPGESAQES